MKEQDTLKCTLMHKNNPVVEIMLDKVTGAISKIVALHNADRLPVGITIRNGVIDRASLNLWWGDRAIPITRSGICEALDALKISDIRILLIYSNAFSLSDQYWIQPENSDLTWERLNFFRNGFSDYIGDILFGADDNPCGTDFLSPDITCDGNLKKRWKIIDSKRCLIKGGSNPYHQQPLNEAIATEIMQRLNIPHVSYTLMWSKGAPYSVCEDFIDENTELIPAWRIIQTKKQPNNKSLYQHFVDCAEELGIPGVRDFLDRMIVLDYIIANEDRHLNNFGAVRNAETLEWLGMAPIYDSGSSLGYDKSVPMMHDESEIICKPFKRHHSEQLKLVSSFGWIDFSALSDVGEMIERILSDENAKDYMEEKRIHAIADLTERRIKILQSVAGEKRRTQIISTDDEVGENVGASYDDKNNR